MSVLKEPGTMMYEPIHRFGHDVRADVLGPLVPAPARRDA
jgi:hypothetical protein